MSDVVAFLRARLDERRKVATAATPGPWGDPTDAHIGDYGWTVFGSPAGETEDSDQGRADAQFIAANHPAVVLGFLDAYSRILDEMEPDLAHDGGGPSTARWTLGVLASAFSDHPDYDPAWDREGNEP